MNMKSERRHFAGRARAFLHYYILAKFIAMRQRTTEHRGLLFALVLRKCGEVQKPTWIHLRLALLVKRFTKEKYNRNSQKSKFVRPVVEILAECLSICKQSV